MLCLDSAHTTAEEPTSSPTTSRSGSSGSRKSRACRGRRLPAALGPIAPPYGAGLKPGSGPTCQHRKALVKLADSLGLGHLFTA